VIKQFIAALFLTAFVAVPQLHADDTLLMKELTMQASTCPGRPASWTNNDYKPEW
jgi:hypothetical protein